MFLHSGASLHNRYVRTPESPTQSPTQSSSSPISSVGSDSGPIRRRPMFRFNLPYPSEAPVAAIPEETMDTTLPSTPIITHRKRSHRRSLIEQPVSSVHLSPIKKRARPVSDYIPRNGHVVRFQEPRVDGVSIPDEEDYQIPNYFVQSAPTSGTNSIAHSSEDDTHSEFSDNSSTLTTSLSGTTKRRSKRLSKTGSRFIVAQPPPKILRKSRRLIQIRPQLLLQIQLVTETRPKPVFDVLPSSFLTGSPIAAPRLARRFPRLFSASGSLGPNDLVLARSEDYGIDENAATEEDHIDRRELIAVFSPVVETGNTDIVLADGTVWTAMMLPNGSYDFHYEAPDGTITHARWAKRRISSGVPVSDSPFSEDVPYKYTFSILDPTTRRHPIMATLTQSYLDVQDYCFLPEPTNSTSPSTSTPRSSVVQRPPASMVLNNDRRFIPVDTETRAFIAISAVWVSLQAKGISTPKSPQARKASVRRSLGALETVKPQSPVPSITSTATSTNTGATSTALKRCSLPVLASEQTVTPRRSMSTGAAFMRRRVNEAQLTIGEASKNKGLSTSPSMGAVDGRDKEKKGLFSSLKRAFSRRKTPRD